jgi:hypothetical protein
MYALILLILQFSPQQNPDTQFADALMHQGDYFRAITEYKRVAFYSTSDSVKEYCLDRISTAYRKSMKYESATEYAAELCARSKIGSYNWYRSNLLLGLAYQGSDMPQLALQYFQTALEYPDTLQMARRYLGAVYFSLNNIDKSLEYFHGILDHETSDTRRKDIDAIIADIEQYSGLPKKSPFLASALSFCVPGAGQIYSHHYYDAVQAFLYTAAAAVGTYALYTYEHSHEGRVVWTYIGLAFTATFHVSNILGANRTAQYYNWKLHENVAQRIRDRVAIFEP